MENKKNSIERLIRSLSIRKRDCPKNVEIGDANKPQSWLEDQRRVRDSSCTFPVEYLGYIEVFESRGIVVCEKAIKALKCSKSKCKKAILYISGDAIRVTDDANKILLVDQTLEKVSFCAPDRNIYEGFAYICRDATAKRWLCHGFLATKDSGERLSHALGCAFAVCLERKQAREKQKTQITSSPNYQLPFTLVDKIRNGDSQFGPSRPFFRQASLLERINDPQVTMVTEPVPSKPALKNEFEIKRPRPSNEFFKRQHSLQLHNAIDNRRSEFNFAASNHDEDGDVFTIYEEKANNNKGGISGDDYNHGDNTNNNTDNEPSSPFHPRQSLQVLSRSTQMNADFPVGVSSTSLITTANPNPLIGIATMYDGGNSFISVIHDGYNSNRKLSDAESWLQTVASSLSISNGNNPSKCDHLSPFYNENGSSHLSRDRGFLSVSNPFSCSNAFDNRLSFNSQASVPEDSLVAFNAISNPFLS